MVLIEGPVLTLTGLTALAGTCIKAWQVLQERRQRRLDREQQQQLQEAQHRHELALAAAKAKEPNLTFISVTLESSAALNTDDLLLSRLQMEAERLSELGFDVAYECIGDSYGLALPLGDSLTFAFLIPPSYPSQAPLVVMRKDSDLEHISFAPGAWQPDIMIADIVTDIAAALVTDSDMQ
jgi:hypothetical protein